MSELENMAFSKNLKKIMKERNVSPKELSEATGIPRSSIGDWLAGTEPRLNESVLKVSRFFGCSLDFLMTGIEPEENTLKKILGQSDESYTEIHSGVYRLKIEKLLKK